MNCPICGAETRPGEPCPLCGYDESCAYEKFPTVFFIGDEASIEARQSAWAMETNGQAPLSAYFRCPVCGAASFLYLPRGGRLVCQLCRSAIPLETAEERSLRSELLAAQAENATLRQLLAGSRRAPDSRAGAPAAAPQVKSAPPPSGGGAAPGAVEAVRSDCRQSRLHLLVSGKCFYNNASGQDIFNALLKLLPPKDAEALVRDPFILAIESDADGERSGIWLTSRTLYYFMLYRDHRRGYASAISLGGTLSFDRSVSRVRVLRGVVPVLFIDCVSEEAAASLARALNQIVTRLGADMKGAD